MKIKYKCCFLVLKILWTLYHNIIKFEYFCAKQVKVNTLNSFMASMLKFLRYISAFQQVYKTMIYYRFSMYIQYYVLKCLDDQLEKNKEKAMFTTMKNK